MPRTQAYGSSALRTTTYEPSEVSQGVPSAKLALLGSPPMALRGAVGGRTQEYGSNALRATTCDPSGVSQRVPSASLPSLEACLWPLGAQ
eukprot:CAMPEP_0174351810 /NCGR_PEP_ID=MMETSP0811_2-20130205/9295_1 /TAXON_ID=73025 ORGANISM="Eutreptiella gymnastica-like, Strain CCMP1594" /NCGR_SAMPLE_ID=MMETSP0811_2 /ASSEMBLY_ACC=CAM_ASM_000667 /LENGTH=89 /DNA_ID=CAMNT_0015481415 /DNA_START=233 /DNA_END=502 /DNA_ORIENTATION=-